jgi:hypothetical protein
VGGRTSQLQIRVSPEQKATLKRLAAVAGLNVSQYVLMRALPRDGDELIDALDRLRKGRDEGTALAALARILPGLDPEDLHASLGGSNLHAMPAPTQNRVAALVEWVAGARGIEPPVWTAAVRPLPKPHFRWHLESLRPYQARATRPTYKRRNLFDPGLPTVRTPEAIVPSALEPLARHLEAIESEVEFYSIGGTLMWQAFPARPRSANPRDLLLPVPDLVAAFLDARGLARAWIVEAVHGLRGVHRWIDIPRITAFEPPLGYALAMKLGCLPAPPSAADLDDLRFLLRSLNVGTEEAALSAVAPYLADRHVPAHAKAALGTLVG